MIQRTSGLHLGFLVSIIKQFKNELKGKRKAFLLEFKEKNVPGWASCKSSVGAEKGRKEVTPWRSDTYQAATWQGGEF